MRYMAIAVLVAFTAAGSVQAGAIERACLASDRPSKKRALCGCIQKAADVTLSGRDQRMAARFFTDPHRAQVARQSDRSNDEQFWTRYQRFGATAEAYCRG
jgi:hypothetical protein